MERKVIKRASWYVRPQGYQRPMLIEEVLDGEFIRRSDIAKLIPDKGIGLELGVAKGCFSQQILVNSNIGHLFSIDMWAGDRGHDTEQYKEALRLLLPYKERNTCLRMKFSEALDLFPDEYFDFIYIDGYAHTGLEKGSTLTDWWPKLKPRGLFSGDDYSHKWPYVMQEVDRFVNEHELQLLLLKPKQREGVFSRYPSWLTFKPDIKSHKVELGG